MLHVGKSLSSHVKFDPEAKKEHPEHFSMIYMEWKIQHLFPSSKAVAALKGVESRISLNSFKNPYL